ncbi:adhesion G-protein coupled receptor G2-like [Ruditapes philippinarum]|uniref:adhesion G-protein coupled receptor G2-like n=1 Tax=Ruditapes philippinarum TaxID=129788 RepID=UPI00295B3E63|nr:adhesion G-protein coupled receptor G2-like [Ruditapes philippinarum]
MLVFLVGIKQTHSYFGCITVAVLLHYLILVSFMWMLMEAILQYLTFVKILGTYITRFTLKTVLPAWGLPLIPVVAVLGVDYTLYKGGPNYCWMDLPAFYYAFAIPITCIIVINIIIFIVTIVSIFRRGKGLRSNQKKQKMAMTNLQAAITSFILLGLTWVFGYLAISDARLTFQYVFTILNSLQGFFIFILFVVRKKKVREQWYFICCKGVEKDRVSRSLSASNSIPSTYSNGSRKDGRERDRSDSTKTVTSTYSNSSNGYTNYGYDHAYDFPFNRYDRRAFKKF